MSGSTKVLSGAGSGRDGNGPLEKVWVDPTSAVGAIRRGDTVLVGGFGDIGLPWVLLEAVLEHDDARDLTIVANNAGGDQGGIAGLLRAGRIAKMVCSYPRGHAFTEVFGAGEVELELVPQGTLAERLRAGAAGIGPFYCPVGVGTVLAKGKEVREFDGVDHLLEHPIRGDVALVHAESSDRLGNLTYRATARNFNPIMAMAAATTVVETRRLLPAGTFVDPEHVVTPGIFVGRVVELPETDS